MNDQPAESPALSPEPSFPGGADEPRRGPVARARASLRALEALDRISGQGAGPPPESDLAALREWGGWGPMAPAFAPGRRGGWREIGERLEWLLPPGQLRLAERATPNAFYTPPPIAAACWQVLTGLGFTGGRVLEPGCGAGAFIAATPAGLRVSWTGVERDPVTAQIAQLLHPAARILAQPLQQAALPAHSADAVIGNVPFSETGVYDPAAPKAVTRSLHNYCIWRSVRTLRPGGVAVLITSRYTLDSQEDGARQAIADDADLAGAIRLPGEALAGGGTEVVADIVVLRRRGGGRPDGDLGWLRALRLSDVFPGQEWGFRDHVNAWFATRPRMVLGEMLPDQGARYGRTLRVSGNAASAGPAEDLAGAGSAIAAEAGRRGLTWQAAPDPPGGAGDLGLARRADGRKERSFHLMDGAVCQVISGELVPAGTRGREAGEVAALVRVRDAAVALLDAEADHDRGDDSLAAPRAALGAAYDRYVAAYGPLNRATVITGEPDPETGLATVTRRRPRMGGFRQDPDYVTVLALENYDEETGAAAKAPIFFRRVNQPPRRPDRAGTPAEAISLCLDARGSLDLDVIGRLLGIPASEVPARLGELAYLDPESGGWVTAEEYLSGNVRVKLHAARQAASPASGAGDAGRRAASVAALERVQPADLGPGEIRARLGAPWIPPADVRDFAEAILGHPPDVTCLRLTAQWEVKVRADLTDTPAATEEWGTSRIDGYRLLELTLNGRAPVVYDVIETPDGEARIRNQAETLLAEDKQRAMAERFAEWAWEDPGRCDRLCAEYNRRFNSVVPRRYDGSHLTFPGLAGGFTPYPHQLDMVHRIVSSPAALCPYPVGTGKTPTMFMAARKLRELSLARKPLIIVPNHLLEQTAAEGKRLFPAARILMAAREDLASAQARKLFAARCATGDWDAVVMTHSAFTAVPVHPATEAAHLSELAARYRQALAAVPDAGKRGVKQMAKMVDAFETRARHLLDHRTDDGVWFEHLGVDFLMVDEAHYFKNLGVPVRTDGFAVAASKRATDLNMKLGLLRQRGGKTAALFTGTPVSNSLLEMYVLQHYLQPGRLAETGLDSADAWAATFVEFQTSVEVTPDGSGFRMKRRPARFENVPELLTLFGEIADLRPPESFDVRRPAARHHTVLIPAGPELLDYVARLAERADRLRQVDAHRDNMLKICGDGRKAALDLELVGITGSGLSKVDAVIGNITRIYHAHRDLELPGDRPGGPRGGFQIVFCDLGTPDTTSGGGAGMYGKIRDGLVAAGVPAGQVRFIHEAATDARKAALFADCRAGKVAVLLGSTDKLGVGTNIQTRCVALHHVDAPWRPADVEQREGRALRPGNLCPQVEVFRYVSEKSFDSFMWQALERKARFIGQVMSGRPAGRDVDDIGDATLSFAEVKAIATGNPLLLDLAEASATVTRLRQLAAGHARGVRRLGDSVAGWKQQAASRTRLAEAWQDVADRASRYRESGWQDDAGNHVAAGDVAGFLAGLADRGLAGSGYPAAHWRGLRIAFSARRDWRQAACVATISAGQAELPVEFSPSWVQKGQQWRIEKELAGRVTGAAGEADRLREQVAELERRVADAQRRMAEPFPRAAELEAARIRRDQIEQQIREAATVPGDGEKPAPAARAAGDRAAGRRHADLGLAGLGDGHEVVVFTPEVASEWASAAEALRAVPVVAARSGTTGTPADDRDRRVPGQRLSGDESGPDRYVKVAGGAVPAGEPDALFALPDSAAADPVPRPARQRRPRRGAARLAALDTPAQPALFDLPAPPSAQPARSTPRVEQSPTPRK